jgi:L-lactate dehydrogenase complex protein LldG
MGLAAKNAYVDPDASHLVELNSTADIWSADIGFSLADWAVAETGSLLLSAGVERMRMTSLAPPIHVAMIQEDRIVGTLEDAIEKWTGRTSVLIAGPSRTADIEGVLVRGVHGPKHLIVAVYE